MRSAWLRANTTTKVASTVLLVLQLLAARNAMLLSSDLLRGDGSVDRITPRPRYGAMRVPETTAAVEYGAVGRIAADFAQIYFPAQAPSPATELSGTDYQDPWQRPSRFAPGVHWLCSITICTLPYGYASLVHVWLQYLIFLASFAYAFRVLHVQRWLFWGVACVNVGLFLTPVGLSFLERGQFSLYVATAYIWVLLGVHVNRASFLTVAALFGYLKWTSLPTLFVITSLWIASSFSAARHRARITGVSASVVMVVLLFAVLSADGRQFLEGVVAQEAELEPIGPSLVQVMPRGAVKLLPLVLVALGVWRLRRSQQALAHLLPFVLGCTVILQLYPTVVFDYNMPCLFGLIPFALEWSRRPDVRDRCVACLVPSVLFVFMAAASTASMLAELQGADLTRIVAYVACSAILMAVPVPSQPPAAVSPA